MRVTTHIKFALKLAAIVVSAAPTVVLGAPATGDNAARPELALTYTYLRSNAPPGGCTCINLSGGSATFAWPLKTGNFAIVGDLAAAHAGGISSPSYDLTLSSYTVGARYSPRFGRSSLKPFGQALIGFAHSSGSLVQGQTTSVPNASASFASNLGGGLTLSTGHRFSIRPIEADYLLTTFNNGSNNHQNNLRISAGIVLLF